jgi:non-ribosomal peptide synthetase component E (peptide arylation enzyme)
MFAKGAWSFYTLFEEAANEVPNSIYLIYQGREWTYLEVKLIVWQRANYFLSQGIKRRGRLLACDVKNRPRRDRYDE